jgi:hypothetical protein
MLKLGVVPPCVSAVLSQPRSAAVWHHWSYKSGHDRPSLIVERDAMYFLQPRHSFETVYCFFSFFFLGELPPFSPPVVKLKPRELRLGRYPSCNGFGAIALSKSPHLVYYVPGYFTLTA